MTDDQPPLRIAVLDDYQAAASGLADWTILAGAETVFFHDHAPKGSRRVSLPSTCWC